MHLMQEIQIYHILPYIETAGADRRYYLFAI